MATKKNGNRSTKPTGRPKPVSGVTSLGIKPRRYGCGGRIKK